jgi:adenylosuccinate lyase
MVQRNAMRAFHGEGDFKTLLGEDPDVKSRLAAGELDKCFDLGHALRWADEIIQRAIES